MGFFGIPKCALETYFEDYLEPGFRSREGGWQRGGRWEECLHSIGGKGEIQKKCTVVGA